MKTRILLLLFGALALTFGIAAFSLAETGWVSPQGVFQSAAPRSIVLTKGEQTRTVTGKAIPEAVLYQAGWRRAERVTTNQVEEVPRTAYAAEVAALRIAARYVPRDQLSGDPARVIAAIDAASTDPHRSVEERLAITQDAVRLLQLYSAALAADGGPDSPGYLTPTLQVTNPVFIVTPLPMIGSPSEPPIR